MKKNEPTITRYNDEDKYNEEDNEKEE